MEREGAEELLTNKPDKCFQRLQPKNTHLTALPKHARLGNYSTAEESMLEQQNCIISFPTHEKNNAINVIRHEKEASLIES